MNVLSDHENIEDHKELEYIFKNGNMHSYNQGVTKMTYTSFSSTL